MKDFIGIKRLQEADLQLIQGGKSLPPVVGYGIPDPEDPWYVPPCPPKK